MRINVRQFLNGRASAISQDLLNTEEKVGRGGGERGEHLSNVSEEMKGSEGEEQRAPPLLPDMRMRTNVTLGNDNYAANQASEEPCGHTDYIGVCVCVYSDKGGRGQTCERFVSCLHVNRFKVLLTQCMKIKLLHCDIKVKRKTGKLKSCNIHL